MSTVAIVGGGRIGHALLHGCPGAHLVSGRELLAKRDLEPLLQGASTVVHAAGPAGEAACKEDPALAFALHYTLTSRLVQWVDVSPGRKLILLGTVAPNVGFYGPLKRAAIEHAFARCADAEGALCVVECGHVIGVGLPVSDRNAGVIARFVQGAVQGGRLVLAGGGEQQIRYTPLAELVTVVKQLVQGERAFNATWSPVSAPSSVADVARTCLNLARLLYEVDRGVMVDAPHRTFPPSYESPTGTLIPVAPLPDVLIAWMRTLEVKILLGVR